MGAEFAAGVASRLGGDCGGRAGTDDLASAVAAFGPKVDDPVGGGDHVEVVLDDHDRVARRDELPERGEEGRNVVEMQSGRGFVEEEQGSAAAVAPSFSSVSRGSATGRSAAALRAGEVARELEALRFPAAQTGHRLAEGEVAEPDRAERSELLQDIRRVREPGDGLVHGEVEHSRNREAVRGELHLQHVAAEAPAVAVRATEVHVAQKLHFEMLEAVARAGGTASLRVVEAEPAGGIAALAGERLGREEPANRVEGAHIARRDRAAGLADRRLVHEHHVRDRLRAVDAVVAPRGLPWPAQPPEESPMANVLDQGRLARAADPGHAHQAAEGKPHVDALQVVLRRAADEEVAAIGARVLPRVPAVRILVPGRRPRSDSAPPAHRRGS